MVKMKVIGVFLAIIFFAGVASAGSVLYDKLDTNTTTSTIGSYTVVSVSLPVAMGMKDDSESDRNDYTIITYPAINTTVLVNGSGDKESVDVAITFPKDPKEGYQGTMNARCYDVANSTLMVPMFIRTGVTAEETLVETRATTAVATRGTTTVATRATEVVNETSKESDPVGDLLDQITNLFGF